MHAAPVRVNLQSKESPDHTTSATSLCSSMRSLDDIKAHGAAGESIDCSKSLSNLNSSDTGELRNYRRSHSYHDDRSTVIASRLHKSTSYLHYLAEMDGLIITELLQDGISDVVESEEGRTSSIETVDNSSEEQRSFPKVVASRDVETPINSELVPPMNVTAIWNNVADEIEHQTGKFCARPLTTNIILKKYATGSVLSF